MSTRRRARLGVATALAVVASLAAGACSSDTKPSSSSTTAGAPTGTVTVLAASSLKDAFSALGKDFEAAHPGTTVTFSFGSSADLEQQIEHGAPADVYASADQTNMAKLVEAGDAAGSPTSFARNKLEIAVEPGNPKHIASLADLARAGLTVVLCDASVPCGKLADQVLENARVSVTPKSRELNVKATLSKVELGEADAAIVYVSDVASAAGKVAGVTIADDVNVVTTLPIVAVKGTHHAAVANAFVAYVVAHEDELVTKFGFLPL